MTFSVKCWLSTVPGAELNDPSADSFNNLTTALNVAQARVMEYRSGVVTSVVDNLVAGHMGDTGEIIRFEELDGHAVVTTPLRAGYERALLQETPQELREYRVNLYTTARVATSGIWAASPQEAALKAECSIDLNRLLSRRMTHEQHQGITIDEVNWDESPAHSFYIEEAAMKNSGEGIILNHRSDLKPVQLYIPFKTKLPPESAPETVASVVPLTSVLLHEISVLRDMIISPESRTTKVDMAVEDLECAHGEPLIHSTIIVTGDGIRIDGILGLSGHSVVSPLIPYSEIAHAMDWGVFPVAPLSTADLVNLPCENEEYGYAPGGFEP
ncbi:hypothetical protein PsaNZ64_00830 [Pseudomonas syringae pv. actinidiae]|uniref:hypothetical protein n=1 Tax=Pseudomonas syringae group TaxID=136849 RepID=UPI0006B8BA33|nr:MULTISPECIES: hypothetical protein [Pseudomonas syringae group]OKS78859.1 hypothetical protein PsaNZ64_00830 [Pseudomonas syringae pv. actinidiae]